MKITVKGSELNHIDYGDTFSHTGRDRNTHYGIRIDPVQNIETTMNTPSAYLCLTSNRIVVVNESFFNIHCTKLESKLLIQE